MAPPSVLIIAAAVVVTTAGPVYTAVRYATIAIVAAHSLSSSIKQGVSPGEIHSAEEEEDEGG